MPRTELPKADANGPVDYLDEDPEIPTQKYCIVSFISPEKVIKDKSKFTFEKFVQWQDYEWKVRGLESFAAFLSKKYSIKIDDVLKDAEEFAKVRKEEIKKTDIVEQYEVFLLKKEKELQEAYDNEVEFRTNVRGVKVRRCFPTVEEAQMFSKVLQRRYPKDSLYIGKVGAWLPWDPSEHLMPEVEYAEKELNELMRRYKENEANKELFFAEEREAAIKAQKEENARRQKLNDAERDAELASKEQKTIEDGAGGLTDAFKPVHPSEGAIRE
jgi:hypothetical protein